MLINIYNYIIFIYIIFIYIYLYLILLLPLDHISLFEDIINRKSHIITNESGDNNKKLQHSNKLLDGVDSEGVKRKFDEMADADTMNNAVKKINVKDKYSNIIEEINFLKDKYKISVNIVDTSNITLHLKEKENKSGEISWNDFINMINTIKREESQQQDNHNLSNSTTINNATTTTTTNLSTTAIMDNTINTNTTPSNTNTTTTTTTTDNNKSNTMINDDNNTNTTTNANMDTTTNAITNSTTSTHTFNNNMTTTTATSRQSINNERVMLVISLNLSNYIDTTEVENEYNIPGDNQSNIVIYARIPKSTQLYCLQGIFDWTLLYTKKKSIFQTSEEDNKLKEKKIYDFILHKLHDQEEKDKPSDAKEDTTTEKTMVTPNKVIKVYHIVEWILEGIKVK